MIVDRNRRIREFLRREFLAEDCRVQEAKSEYEVMRIIDSDVPPDLIILDLDLPVECAFSLLGRLKEWEPPIPVVIYTFLTDFSNLPAVQFADAFVEKCEDLTQLKQSVADVLRRRYPQRHAQAQ